MSSTAVAKGERNRPFSDYPVPLRIFTGAVTLAAVAGLVLVVLEAGAGDFGRAFARPGLWVLVLLVLATDLYQVLPWMRQVQGRMQVHWSAVLALALLLAYGAPTIVLMPVISVIAGLSIGGALWRRVFNTAVLVLEGLVALGVRDVVIGGTAPELPLPATDLLLAGVLVAVLWQVLNVALIATAQQLSHANTWWNSFTGGMRWTLLWLGTLIAAPMVAALAVDGPVLLVTLVPVVVVVHHTVLAVTRRSDEARTDPLTGLANRAAAMEMLDVGLDGLDRRAREVTMLLIDLDGFKAVNDTLGHHAGDVVLVEIGRRIRVETPEPHLVGRLGGDEFVIVGTDLEDGDALAAAITERMRTPVKTGSSLVVVEGSVGWASAHPGSDPMDLFRLVDRNLYRFKHGRTRPDIRQNLSR